MLKRLTLEPLEDRRLLSVGLNWAGAGSVLSLTEDTFGATPTIAISEPSPNFSQLWIDLGAGQVFADGSTISTPGLTYENPDSPTTSQFAIINIGLANNVSGLVATLPGDTLTFGQIRDLNSGIGGIDASAETINVTGINTFNANVDLKATGNLTIQGGAIVTTGTGTISLSADVKADGAGDDGIGTLSINAGATVTSTNATDSAITLRGADIDIDTSADPAVVGASRQLSTTPTATLTGLDHPDALAFDSSGNLYVANEGTYNAVGHTVSEFAPGSTAPTTTLTGLYQPYALAFDSSGNLYVAGGWGVTKFAPGSTTPTATLTGLSGFAAAMAFDSSGNLYVANGDGVTKFAPGSTTPTTTLTGLSGPAALAFDSSGNLYVANYDGCRGTTVSKFAPGATTPTATLAGLSGPCALAFDSSGNLYVANDGAYNNNNIYNGTTVSKFAPGATTPTATLSGLLNRPCALAFDSIGNLYVANLNAKTVSEFAPGHTAPTATLTGLLGPCALAFDSSGNLYVANWANGTVSEFAPGSSLAPPTAGGVVIRSSLSDRPISLGGTNSAVAGINLTDAELLRIQTIATGTLTVGDSAQTGNITFTNAKPATTHGASTLVVQDTAGSGQIILDDAKATTGLDGNSGTVTLTPGTGGIVTSLWAWGARESLATKGFNATGLAVIPSLNCAPYTGMQFRVISNTATPASGNPITGEFTNLAQGETISASYGGDTYFFQVDYAGGDGNDLVLTNVQLVQTISFDPIGSHVYGDQVSLAATASSGLPVSFSVISGPASLEGGNLLTVTGIGTVIVEATQSGNTGYAAADPVDISFDANPATLIITADNQTKVYGATPMPTLTYTVHGLLGSDTLTTEPTLSTDAAINSHVGSYTISASGAAASSDYTIAYANGTFSVTPAPLTITPDSKEKIYGGLLPALTISSYVGLVNGDTIADIAVLPTASTLAKATSPVGVYAITAAGASDPDYAISYVPGNLAIVKRGTTVSLVASSPNPSVFGQSVTFTAIVSAAPGLPTPVGKVIFFRDGHILGRALLDASGHASINCSTLKIGSHTIKADYRENRIFLGSISDGVTQTVVQATTSTLLTASADPALFGDWVTFTATVSVVDPGHGRPRGKVVFSDGDVVLDTVNVNSLGRATLHTSDLSSGSHAITASYSGDTKFLASHDSLTEPVVQATTVTVVVTSPHPTVFGEPITFTATVKAMQPAWPLKPTGAVTFSDGGALLGTVSLDSKGRATLSTSALTAGPHVITVFYGGAGDFAASTGSILPTIAQAATSVALTASAASTTSGQWLTFTALVSVDAPGVGLPTGTVTFSDFGTFLGTGTIGAGGTTTFSTASLAIGSHLITASYNGDENFKNSRSSSVAVKVGPSTGAAILSATADFGQTPASDIHAAALAGLLMDWDSLDETYVPA
jgi:hypothetical protein